MGDKLWFEYLDLAGRTGELWQESPLTVQQRQQAVEDFAAVCEWVRFIRLWRPNLPDAGDDHIMELAIAGNAAAIVTFNTRDFREALFAPVGLEVIPPGQFMHKYPK
jgi:uncharacterized protein